MKRTADLHVAGIAPLISPVEMKRQLPISDEASKTVVESREAISDILRGTDRRMLLVVGPCSIHDTDAALDYAERLADLRRRVQDVLYPVMRVYFEKPRTRLGWRGLILDPHLDGSYDIEAGIRSARKLLLRINEIGVPTGSEMLDPIVPQYIDELISWASIGARTTESQTHREMASGLSMPVGFKNSTDGSIGTAVNAFAASFHPHAFLGIDQQGQTSIIHTTGNPLGHVILRGGRDSPNFDPESVEEAKRLLAGADLPQRLIIDCSHANSQKEYGRQVDVLRSVAEQRAEGNKAIRGAMMESFIYPGRQDIPADIGDLAYGVSITDACLGWDETEQAVLEVREVLRSAPGG